MIHNFLLKHRGIKRRSSGEKDVVIHASVSLFSSVYTPEYTYQPAEYTHTNVYLLPIYLTLFFPRQLNL